MSRAIGLLIGCITIFASGSAAEAQFLQAPDVFCRFQQENGGMRMICTQTDVVYFNKVTSEFYDCWSSVDGQQPPTGKAKETITAGCEVEVQAFTTAGSYTGSAQIRTIVQSPPPSLPNWSPYTRDIKNLYWTFDDTKKVGSVCKRGHFDPQAIFCGVITIK
jgi:hypothetical protein